MNAPLLIGLAALGLSVWATDRVVAILEEMDIRGEGVGLVWVFVGCPAIAAGVWRWAERVVG